MRSRKTIGGAARIVRDSYFNKSLNQNWWDIRKRVFERDNGVCGLRLRNGTLCGAPAKDVHHIIPLSRGGTTTFSNLLAVCESCHRARHSHL